MGRQMMLFEIEQQRRDDGSFVVTPRAVADEREIGIREAMRLLGYKCPKPVRRLIEAGLIEAWKPDSRNGNAHFRISMSSVIDYKRRRSSRAGD